MKDAQPYIVIKSILIGLCVCAGIICLWKGLGSIHVTDKDVIQKKIDSLQRHSDSLMNYISVTEKKVDELGGKIDSIEKLKPKIIVKYVNKYKEIDSASVRNVIGKFDSIFTNSGIKR